MTIDKTDFLIIGGGIIGINMAIQAKRRYPDCSVVLIEKEGTFGVHASGRNSGVLHAGFYYTADSLKAKFTRDGNKALTEFCYENGLPVNQCGKLVVAKNEEELAGLQELLKRARNNKVQLQEISAQDAKEIEPRVKTFEKALYSPTTASVDPKLVLQTMQSNAKSLGVIFNLRTKYVKRTIDGVLTNNGNIIARYVINSAGLYADKIAKDYGFSKRYTIIPFKGLYIVSDEPPGSVKTNIYPVPDLNNPFLGVHFTVTVGGKAKLGPTAIPAFWREHYKGFSNFNLSEMMQILLEELRLMITNQFGFRKIAMHEVAKYYKPVMINAARELLSDLDPRLYTRHGLPGIRAQLFDAEKGALEMDFKYEGDENSFHILNAVSPAFTCSIPFTSFLFDQIDELIR